MEKFKSFLRSDKAKLGFLSVLILALIIGCIYSVTKISNLEADLIQRPKDDLLITEFKEKNESDLMVNEEALKSFEKESDASGMKYVFDTEDGIILRSDTDNWNVDQLKALYEELLSNEHGEEIKTLREINVHGAANESTAGTHQVYEKTYEFAFDFPAIPEVDPIDIVGQFGTINLYKGDVNKTIRSQAFVLSHEYGHHYTSAHMFDDGFSLESDYAKARKLNENTNVLVPNGSYENYLKEHHWYLQEIAADDYVQLMGSPTVKRAIDYSDIKELVNKNNYERMHHSINGTPQENFLIPLAFEVDGLYDYFYSFTNSTKQKPEEHPKEDIKITIKPKSESFALISGYKTFYYYEITWNKPYLDDGVIYTLICYEEEYDYPLPVKTVYANESAKAIIGAYPKSRDGYVAWRDDQLATGTKYFVVTTTFEDGTVLKSEPVKYNFK